MNDRVKAFLDAKKAEDATKYEKEKQRTLIELGLYNREYSPDGSSNGGYPFSEWDSSKSEFKYYKNVPIEITDEEYQEVKKYSKKEDKIQTNPIAIALTIIAYVIFFGGFIAGIAFGTSEVINGYDRFYVETEFSFGVAFTYWCISLISGTMLLGFAEIIKLLDAIKRK